MPRAQSAQFNIRSAFVRKRVHELAKLTGMTATQVVEDALRGYVPPGQPVPVGRLVRKGPLLVIPAHGRKITLAEANAALEAVRMRDDQD